MKREGRTPADAPVASCAAPERRRFLRSAAALLGAPLAASCVNSLPPKISKAAASYQPFPQGNMRCGECLYFIAPASGCRIVEGDIRHGDWCRYWTPRKGSTRTVASHG